MGAMSPELRHLVGRRMRMMRELSGATIAEMAQAMGISTTKLAYIENGRSEPTLTELLAFCSLLDIPLAFIAGQSDTVPIPLPWTSETGYMT